MAGIDRRQLIQRLRRASWRDLLLVGLPSLLLIVAAFWVTSRFIQPAPPDRLVLASGPAGGGYERYASAYKPLLAREGFTLEEKPTSGALENIALLRDPDSGVDAAFIQGGAAAAQEDDDLYSLGALYQEPVWIFYREALFAQRPVPDRLRQLKGLRIAVGGVGSGNRALAVELLRANGLTEEEVSLQSTGGLDAVRALASGRSDAAILVGPAESAGVWSLFYTPGVRALSLAQAEAYVRKFPHLSHLVLPRGSVDLVRDIPDRDVDLVAPTATLVVRGDTHPALVDLLLQAAAETHGGPGLLQKAGDFPKAQAVDFPLSPRAERFYKSGRPLLQRYLPFWLANLIDRLVVMLIPLVAVFLPVVKLAPSLYGWRVRSRVFKRYGELKVLEAEVQAGNVNREDFLRRLDAIEQEVVRIPAPLAFSDLVYTLRAHLEVVRAAILRHGG